MKFKNVATSSFIISLMLFLSIVFFDFTRAKTEELLIVMMWHFLLAGDVFIGLLVVTPLSYPLIMVIEISESTSKKIFLPALALIFVYFVVLFLLNAPIAIWVISMVFINAFIIKSLAARNNGT